MKVKNRPPICAPPDVDTESPSPADFGYTAVQLSCFIAEILGPEEALERAELCELVREVVDSLPAREAEGIRAYYFDDEHLTDLARNTMGTKSMFSRIHIKAKARLIRRITQLFMPCSPCPAACKGSFAAGFRSNSRF